MFISKCAACIGTVLLFAFAAIGQDNQKYTKNGVSFEYSAGWIVSENAKGEADEIALSNKEADAQITFMAIRKPIDAKDPIAESKKRVVEPWLTSLIDRYRAAGVAFKRSEIRSEVAGKAVDGVELAFFYDGQPGKLEAYWALFDKQLVLLYIIRPDRMAEKASPGWKLAKRTLIVEPAAKK